jgi:hypothetical protein
VLVKSKVLGTALIGDSAPCEAAGRVEAVEGLAIPLIGERRGTGRAVGAVRYFSCTHDTPFQTSRQHRQKRIVVHLPDRQENIRAVA